MTTLVGFLTQLQAIATEADERRAGILVEVFERERPDDYKRLLAVAKLTPEAALEQLAQHYFAIRLLQNYPNWPAIVVFTQRAILLNETHKRQRKGLKK